MYSFLLKPRWLAALVFTTSVVVVFILLGNWQLERHEELGLDNQIRATRLAAEPLDLGSMLDAAGPSIDSLAYRRATVEGTFDPESEIFVRNQVDDGSAGFHVITPLETETGTLLVNRGWVPLAAEKPPVPEAPPPEGEVEVEVLVRLSEERPRFGRVEPEGELTVVNRIDLERLDQQFDELMPVWGQLVSGEPGLPRELNVPAFDDDGPHLEYALQWYAFAVIAVGGAVFLIRSTAKKPGRAEP